MGTPLRTFTLAALLVATLEPRADTSSAALRAEDIDARRSLAVTEVDILRRFEFQRVLDQLVAQSGVPGMTGLVLFQQWWDTQNPRPGLRGPGVHCDDEQDMHAQPILNAFPYSCRAAHAGHEGSEAASNPFPSAYMPVGLFNRFDLAPADGSHCGEYRIAYARSSGLDDANRRNFILFEAVMPNPRPELGLKGCKKIAQFWAALSKEPGADKRARKLEAFYFDGIDGLPPVVHVGHYGDNQSGLGQIRTNQFMIDPAVPPKVWSLREYKLRRSSCTGHDCAALAVVPVPNKNNPYGPLFASTSTHARASAFQAEFATTVPALAAQTLDEIGMAVPDAYSSGQSQASGSSEGDYPLHFQSAPAEFPQRIEAALPPGSALTAGEVILRARAMSCAGCHRSSNNAALGGGLVWPPSLGFTHVGEQLEPGADPPRHELSRALLDVFLPARQRLLADFLNDKPPKVRRPSDPIGGRSVH
ncbi:hypothetical protein [Piscinibacter sp.]|uniref:hypothetical protein n=1 Tax=Piscinibacter sp. TaxID=1903157 RepID=UPI002C776714|nr:hypothetical protein [Albitalea sp.]HUG23685.1 hypothetical protein [Albitalea sp.]